MPDAPKWIGFADIRKLEENRKKPTSSPPAAVPHTLTVAAPAAAPPPVTVPDTTPVSLPENISHTKRTGEPLRAVPDTADVTLSADARVQGHLRVPNDLLDRIFPSLRPPEQLVLLRLYRLSHGFGKTTCTVNIPKLASACHMGTTPVRLAVQSLSVRGYIRRLGTDLENADKSARGTEFEVLPTHITSPTKTAAARGTAAGGGAAAVDNKVKDLKETQKADWSHCPDCKGATWYYPEGVEKGVRRCEHIQVTGVTPQRT
jgi:hypothetical protein